MNILREFFSTSWWQEIRLKFFGSLGLTGFGYTADAFPTQLTQQQLDLLTRVEVMYKVTLLVSSLLSCIMILTVIAKFGFFLIDRYKNRKNGNSNSSGYTD